MRIIDWSSDVCSSDLGIVPTAIAVSRTAWERLPAEYKTMLEELRPEAQRLVIDAYTEADARWIPAFKEAGLEEIRISSETLTEVKEIAGRPIWEKWRSEERRVGKECGST